MLESPQTRLLMYSDEQVFVQEHPFLAKLKEAGWDVVTPAQLTFEELNGTYDEQVTVICPSIEDTRPPGRWEWELLTTIAPSTGTDEAETATVELPD